MKARLAERVSVRGAFGPDGMIGADGRRRSSDDMMNRAQVFQLDRCLDHKEFSKIIYQFGSAAEAKKKAAAASADEILEYDITLTGYVDQMKIVTLEEAKQSQLSDDPLQSLVDLGRRSASSIVAMFAIGKGSSRQ